MLWLVHQKDVVSQQKKITDVWEPYVKELEIFL